VITFEEAAEVAALFRLLGDPTRLRILCTLRVEEQEWSVAELSALIETEPTTVSHALRLLRTAGVVRSRRDGRRVLYALADMRVRALLKVTAGRTGA